MPRDSKWRAPHIHRDAARRLRVALGRLATRVWQGFVVRPVGAVRRTAWTLFGHSARSENGGTAASSRGNETARLAVRQGADRVSPLPTPSTWGNRALDQLWEDIQNSPPLGLVPDDPSEGFPTERDG